MRLLATEEAAQNGEHAAGQRDHGDQREHHDHPHLQSGQQWGWKEKDDGHLEVEAAISLEMAAAIVVVEDARGGALRAHDIHGTPLRMHCECTACKHQRHEGGTHREKSRRELKKDKKQALYKNLTNHAVSVPLHTWQSM